MAYVVARPSGRWELRESRSTPAGPRARTLATFRALTDEVLERAGARASRPLDREAVRASALRAGAPVADEDVNRAAGELLAQLAGGRRPRAALHRLLLDALQDERVPRLADRAPSLEAAGTDNARAAAQWISCSAQARGEALRDLLLLGDRLPSPRTRPVARFPRLRSKVA
jgi:hypothetical protein